MRSPCCSNVPQKEPTRRRHFFLMSVLLFLLPAFTAYAAPPTILLGVQAEPLVDADSVGDGVLPWALEAQGLISFRTLLEETGYLSFLADLRAGLMFLTPVAGTDQEQLSLELGFPIGDGKLVGQAFLHSSFQGTIALERFTIPEWEIRYFFLDKPGVLNPYLAYTGSVQIQPEESTDHLSQGIMIGCEYQPSYLASYGLALEASWEHWYESILVTETGTQADDVRNDLLLSLTGTAGGIIGLYLDWDVTLSVLLRLSTANRYLTLPAVYEGDIENSLQPLLKARFSWSPSSHLTFEAAPFVGATVYFTRSALSESGALRDQTALIVSLGGLFRTSWTPDNLFYLFLEVNGEKSVVNTAEEDMDASFLRIAFGVKMTLQ
ncbi:MAG TPA: hypothetical protein ENN69_04645 [Spirochaetia bacterium]|nr:hypothetical protein [Spirochaetia bacterium]